MTRIAAVLWSGAVGGAETFTADLCRTMRDLGADPGILFLTRSEPLGRRLDAAGIPHASLGLARGREVIRHPRALARAVQALGPDGVLLASGGYLAAALRAGGYRGRVVVGGHDMTLELGHMTLRDRLVRPLDRATGFWASDVDVAVSDFVLSHMRRQPRRGRLIRIYNGVDLSLYTGSPRFPNGEAVTIAYGGRLIDGKGVDVLLRGFAAGAAREGARLRIAGDGAARPMLQGLAAGLGLNSAVEFTGWAFDMPSFWRTCDIAAMPSEGCVESFGMAAVEAMACARPVIVTANGALPELVDDGVTGFVVPPGDAGALADALVSLTRDPEKRRAAGSAARARCEQRFDIRDCAASYLGLFQNGAGD
jgi:glycosyltransferase involved in cell wall biosynthesis